MSSRPGELLRVKNAPLEAPFLAPLSKMATLGLSACTNVGDPAAIPWRSVKYRSNVPSRLLGQTKAYSLVQVKSPSSTARKRPKRQTIPVQRPSSAPAAFSIIGLNSRHDGFAAPPPGSGVVMAAPSEVTT